MLSDRTKDALDGIRLNLEAIADFVKDKTFEQFANDRMTFYAVTRALEIVSEASRRLPEDLKARYPAIRWRAITALEMYIATPIARCRRLMCGTPCACSSTA